MKIKAVTFDFYNTLVRHRQGSGRGAMLMEYLQAAGLQCNPWEHQALYDVFAKHGAEYSPDLSVGQKQTYYRRLAERVFRRLNVRAPSGTAATHAANIWNILGPASLSVFEDVPDVLQTLRQAGCGLAVVSNWQCGLRHFCVELGIGDAFDHVLASAEVGFAKPDSEIFQAACRRLGVPARRVLHVGDSVVDDFEGARSAGLNSVLVRRGLSLQGDTPPSIQDLNQLPGLLGSQTSDRSQA